MAGLVGSSLKLASVSRAVGKLTLVVSGYVLNVFGHFFSVASVSSCGGEHGKKDFVLVLFKV